MIEQIVARKVTSVSANDVSAIGTTGLSLGVGATRPGTVQIICGMNGPSVRSEKDALYVSLPTKQAKPLAIMIKEIFPAAVSFAQTHDILRGPAITILATDSSRQLLDLSIALTLVLLVLFFNDKGTIPFSTTHTGVPHDNREGKPTKEIIRTRLIWIVTARGQQAERLTRQTLKIVNTYLMSPLPPPPAPSPAPKP